MTSPRATDGGAAGPAVPLTRLPPPLQRSVRRFIDANGNFESSAVVDELLAAVWGAADANELFALPLQHKLFGMDAALKWALFLAVAQKELAEDAFFAGPSRFSAEVALDIIAEVYDRGVQDAVWECFSDSESDSESESGDEAGPESALEPAPESAPAPAAVPESAGESKTP